MKVLVIYAHPNPKSFNKALLNKTKEVFLSNGHQIETRDLYELKFDPVLAPEDFVAMQSGNQRSDVKHEQDFVSWADLIFFIFPNWWYGMPAILKGYVDRVFSFGFVYQDVGEETIGLLKEKKAIAITTNGATIDEMKTLGAIDAFKTTIDFGIFDFCGIDFLEHIYFGGVSKATDLERKGYLEELENKLFKIASVID